MIKDFAHFTSRTVNHFESLNTYTYEIWCNQLTNLNGALWRKTRCTFSPIFTTNKMKNTVPLIQENTKEMLQKLDEVAENGKEIELKDLCTKYLLDTLSYSSYGLNTKNSTINN